MKSMLLVGAWGIVGTVMASAGAATAPTTFITPNAAVSLGLFVSGLTATAVLLWKASSWNTELRTLREQVTWLKKHTEKCDGIVQKLADRVLKLEAKEG